MRKQKELIRKKKNLQKLKLPHHLIRKINRKNCSPYKKIEEPENNRKGKTVKKNSETFIFGLHEVLLRYEREANNQEKKKWAKFKLPSQISGKHYREKISPKAKIEDPGNKCTRNISKINSEALALDFQKYSSPHEDILYLDDLEIESGDVKSDIQDDDLAEFHTIKEKVDRKMKIEKRWAKKKSPSHHPGGNRTANSSSNKKN